MTMQIARHTYHPIFQTYMNNPHVAPSHTTMMRGATHARSVGGGLDSMGMINRVRFAKAGCSSCGGAR